MSGKLNKENAYIWRIVHRSNIPWILDKGLHCLNSNILDPNYVGIGNIELIDRRSNRDVPIDPHGTLSDYIPFYFTPYSPMMYNIHTGRGGVERQMNKDICILVSSLPKAQGLGLSFVFTDRHAYLPMALYFKDLSDLDKIDWEKLQARDFRRDPKDPERFEKYQAEALIYHNLPTEALIGILCYDDTIKRSIDSIIVKHNLKLSVHVKPIWYF